MPMRTAACVVDEDDRPRGPILMPPKNVAAFIDEFNETYACIGLRMRLSQEGHAELVKDAQQS
ncbi:MAG: hypothetical protein AAGD07_01085 [Planctomycetota bacterium]